MLDLLDQKAREISIALGIGLVGCGSGQTPNPGVVIQPLRNDASEQRTVLCLRADSKAEAVCRAQLCDQVCRVIGATPCRKECADAPTFFYDIFSEPSVCNRSVHPLSDIVRECEVVSRAGDAKDYLRQILNLYRADFRLSVVTSVLRETFGEYELRFQAIVNSRVEFLVRGRGLVLSSARFEEKVYGMVILTATELIVSIDARYAPGLGTPSNAEFVSASPKHDQEVRDFADQLATKIMSRLERREQ